MFGNDVDRKNWMEMEGKPVVRRVVCTAWAERSARWDREWHRLSLNWHPLYESEEKDSNQRNPSELGEEEDDDFLARSDEEKRKKEEEQNEDGAWFNKPGQSKARSPIIAFFFSHFLYFFFINLLQKKKLSQFKIQFKDKCGYDIFILFC